MSRQTQHAVAAAAFACLVVAAPVAHARLSDTGPSTTLLPPLTPPSTATAPASSDDTTTTTSSDDTTTTAPLGGDGADAEGLSPLGGGPGQVVPPDAAAFIASLHRSAPNDDRALVDGEHALIAAGYDREKAARIAYGHFPVAGPAHWSDDWLEPRFNGTEFGYHLGVDVIAPYGTPLRAPDDGVIGVDQTDVGGLTVKVIRPDGTFYELAHLSAIAPGVAPGAAVHTGDLVGFVGTTGDATGPHLHLGLWAGGVTPRSPKPLLDQWAGDAAANLKMVLNPQHAARSFPGAVIARELADGSAGSDGATAGASTTDLLLASAGNPTGGAVQLAKAAASAVAGTVDWTRRADERSAARAAWAASTARAWIFLRPLTPLLLQPLLEPAPTPARASWLSAFSPGSS